MFNYEIIAKDSEVDVFKVVSLLSSKLNVEPKYVGYEGVIHIKFATDKKINLPVFLEQNGVCFRSCFVMDEKFNILDTFINNSNCNKSKQTVELEFV